MRRALVPFVLVGVVLAGCSSDGDDASADLSNDAAAEDVPADATTTESDDVATVSVVASEQIGLVALVEVDAERPVTAQVTATSGDHVVETARTAAAATTAEVPVVGLRAERDYELSVELFDDDGNPVTVVSDRFTTDPLPTWIVDHDVDVDAARSSPGYTIVEFDPAVDPDGPEFTQYLAAYDDAGEIVWYYRNSGTLGGVEQTDTGTFLMHYWPFGIREVDMAGDVPAQWRPQPLSVPPGEVDDDALLEEVDPEQVEIYGEVFDGNPGDAAPTPVRADWVNLTSAHHENWPMDNGNILTLSTTTHELTDDQRAVLCPDDPLAFDVISDVVVEYTPDGTVVRTWDLWDAIDVIEFPGSAMCEDDSLFAEPLRRDWTHANSAIYDPERDAVLVSVRHTDQIVAFDHLDAEGPQSDVRWILGDGATMPLDGGDSYHQHAVEVLDDGSLIVFDNGNGRPGTAAGDPDDPFYSRAVIYAVDDHSDDPADWSARQTWEYRAYLPDGSPVYTSFIGDADVLANGNVLITFGGMGTFPPNEEDPLGSLVVEVVPSGESGGEVVWQLLTLDDGPVTTYRSERIESFYVGDDWTERL